MSSLFILASSCTGLSGNVSSSSSPQSLKPSSSWSNLNNNSADETTEIRAEERKTSSRVSLNAFVFLPSPLSQMLILPSPLPFTQSILPSPSVRLPFDSSKTSPLAQADTSLLACSSQFSPASADQVDTISSSSFRSSVSSSSSLVFSLSHFSP